MKNMEDISIKEKTILEQLKEATASLHEQIEQQNPAQDILNHSIDLPAYKELLLQNYHAYRHVESQTAPFLPFLGADKSDRLREDLEALNLSPVERNLDFQVQNRAEAFGAAYVVEGSALGGMVLAKHLQQCEQLKGLGDQQFFSGDKDSLSTWKRFKQELVAQEFSDEEKEELLAKAQETFLFFEKAYQQQELPN